MFHPADLRFSSSPFVLPRCIVESPRCPSTNRPLERCDRLVDVVDRDGVLGAERFFEHLGCSRVPL